MSGQFLGLLLLLYYFKSGKVAKYKKLIFISLALFLGPFLIFTNLHIIHSYYQVANSLFFSVGLGVAIAALITEANSTKKRNFINLLFVAIIASNLYFYLKGSLKEKVTGVNPLETKILLLAEYIKNNTSIDRPVIWYGHDWSSEGPFYSERKSLAVPAWIDQLDPIIHMERYLKEAPSAIVLCETPGKESVRQAILDYAKNIPLASQTEVAKCEVFQFI
jgi:asparagine N-glycosylation enzyme membrane subunit Stt3